MRFYKWLAGLVAAIFFTLAVAWLSSYFFKFDAVWYDSLLKPFFTPKPAFFELCVTLSYVFSTVSLARLIVKKNFGIPFLLLIAAGICSAFFVLAFFYFKQVYAAAAVAGLIFALSMAYTVVSFLKDFVCAVSYLPVCVWHAFAFILSFAVALSN